MQIYQPVMFRSLISLFFIFSSSMAAADAVPSLNRSIRALGMGGAYAAIATGNDALFYNPAMLAYNSQINIELVNVALGVNGLTALEKVQNAGDLSDPVNQAKLMGTHFWLGSGGRISLIAPYFGLSLGTDYEADMYFRNPSFPEIETYFRNDTDTRFSVGFGVGDKGAVGVTVKRIARWGGDTLVLPITAIADPTSLANIQDNFTNKGTGYGVDLAAMYKWDGLIEQSFAIVGQDIGGTEFKKTAGNDNPSHIKDNLVLSYGMMMDLPGFDWSAAVDYRHANSTGIDSSKKIHVGTEFSLPLIDLRFGASQGYMSYGAGFDLFLLRLDAVMYKEELGAYAGQNGEDRILVGLTLDLGFDANFNFVDNKTGKKLKLKQRR